MRKLHFSERTKNMKKTISALMALCMILSVCFFSVSAAEATVGSVAAGYTPEGTPITNAAEFAAMAADGKYYLANDITLDATWNAGSAASSTYKENTAFTGTFDGNGKTVTTSVALFANLQGTVKNLVVEGAIDAGGLHGSNISMWSNGALTVENVWTKATITNGNTCGGVLGYGATGTEATIINCRNDADITCTNQVGGIVGYVQDYTANLTGCVNYGNLNTANYGAGIIGRFGRDAAVAPKSVAVITDCTNYGSVTGAQGQTAGILGYLIGDVTITGCVNYGAISNANAAKAATAAGIFGATGTKADTAILIDSCVNFGKISSQSIAGGIGGRVGRGTAYAEKNFTVSNCINYGDIEVTLADAFPESVYVGGVAGYTYGGTANKLFNCVNAGDITVNTTGGSGAYVYYVGGVIGYTSSSTYECKNNVNAGNISTTGNCTVTLIVYNKNAENNATSNNYSVAIAGIDVAAKGDPAAEPSTFAVAPEYGTAVSAEQIANGTVAGLINEAAGETIYYQAIGTDKAPVLTAAEDGSNAIVKNADGTFGNPVKEPEVTEPEVTEPETTEPVIPENPTTGDSAVILAVIAVISILGVAVVAKRHEN